ncbi:hypothetical protein V2O64_25365 (plasmid) [Verrucomicrobiaceae bacterium 227]
MSAGLLGGGAFFLLRDLMAHGAALSISLALVISAAALLYTFASKLGSRAARAFVGLALLFGAICYGVQDEGRMFALSVLWAGILFGALDSLGKLTLNRRLPVDPA